MSQKRFALLGALVLFSACARPLPEDKQAWVGLWSDGEVTLRITAGGRLEYENKSGAVSKSVEAPIQELTDRSITAGVSFLRTSFTVTQPPTERDGSWTLVVDGRELAKVDPDGRPAKAKVVPQLEELRRLVGDDVRRLNKGIQTRDFTEYRGHASRLFQSQFSNEKLEEAFGPFIERKLDLEQFMTGELVLTAEPTISPEGKLSILGRYPSEDGPALVVAASFVYSGTSWRSLGMNVQLVGPE